MLALSLVFQHAFSSPCQSLLQPFHFFILLLDAEKSCLPDFYFPPLFSYLFYCSTCLVSVYWGLVAPQWMGGFLKAYWSFLSLGWWQCYYNPNFIWGLRRKWGAVHLCTSWTPLRFPVGDGLAAQNQSWMGPCHRVELGQGNCLKARETTSCCS